MPGDARDVHEAESVARVKLMTLTECMGCSDCGRRATLSPVVISLSFLFWNVHVTPLSLRATARSPIRLLYLLISCM
jgi:hypothetical protein